MASTIASAVIANYCQTHQRLLSLAEKASEAQLQWRATPHSHTIAFHLWHVARWADFMQAAIPGMTSELQQRLPARTQIWESEALAVRWGFAVAALGYSETGMQMSDEVARQLPFPEKIELLAYVRRAFAAVDEVARRIDDRQFQEAEQRQPLTKEIWSEGTVGGVILEHIVHDNRHLGAIESLLGLQTGSGTASV
jgi:hypothetical protein